MARLTTVHLPPTHTSAYRCRPTACIQRPEATASAAEKGGPPCRLELAPRRGSEAKEARVSPPMPRPPSAPVLGRTDEEVEWAGQVGRDAAGEAGRDAAGRGQLAAAVAVVASAGAAGAAVAAPASGAAGAGGARENGKGKEKRATCGVIDLSDEDDLALSSTAPGEAEAGLIFVGGYAR